MANEVIRQRCVDNSNFVFFCCEIDWHVSAGDSWTNFFAVESKTLVTHNLEKYIFLFVCRTVINTEWKRKRVQCRL